VNREATTAPSPWLFGPARDLLFGCGLVYVLVFAALALDGDAVRAALPIGYALLPTLFVSGPHYGATLLRVYDRSEDRRKYRFFALWSTLALALFFAWGLRDVVVGSWMATVYLTWSPWHYSGQNFGVGMMFLRRRGVDVTPAARRLYWWSFAFSFALTFLAVHGADPKATYAVGDFADTALHLVPLGAVLGVPTSVQGGAMIVVGVAYVATTLGAFALLRRKASARDLLPAAAIVVSQALWFAAPTLARQWNVAQRWTPLSTEHAAYVFVWIAAAHALQYLWITSYYAVRAGGARRHAAFLVKALLAGAAIWTIPALLFAPRALGRLPYDAGLALLVASFVNLHHFVLDGAIWKLRDGRIAKILLGGGDAPAAAVTPNRARRFAFAAVGAACLVVAVIGAYELEFGFNPAIARDDLPRAESAATHLAWIGRDSAEMHLQIGDRAEEKGDVAAARRHFRDAIALRPTAWAWIELGKTYAREEDWRQAASAFDAALALEPSHPIALLYAGVVDFNTGRADAGRARLLRARDAATKPDELAEIEEAMRTFGVR
jgi:tetratricopeptide (TPR) repeat protein